MDLAAHFAAMWRHRLAVVAASLVVAVVVYGGLSLESKVYQATAQLSVISGQATSGQQPASQVTPFLAASYATLAQTRPVLADAAKGSGLGISEQTADDRISVQQPGGIGYLTITATGPSPHAATALDGAETAALTNAVQVEQQQALQSQLASIQSELNKLQAQISSLPKNSPQLAVATALYNQLLGSSASSTQQPQNSVQTVSPANPGSSPVAPQPKRYALLAFVTALVLLAELSVGYELVSDRFSRATRDDEIRRLTGLPVLARIPRIPGPELVEAFRTLRTSLLFMNGASKTRSIAIVSSAPEVGKSFVSINLASSFADLGIHAALVDADMRRPAIASRLGISDSPGLSEALNGGDVADRLIGRRTESGFNIFVMPAGAPAPDPAALLTGRLSEWVFPGLSGFDAVVVDTPAEALFPDASIIAARCDTTVIVIDAMTTKRRSLKALLDHLEAVGAHPQGVVVNRVPEPVRVGRYYSSRSGYYERSKEAEQVPQTN